MIQEINEIKIIVPEGMEIDKENSTFECIKFKKKKVVAWRNKKEKFVNGFYIENYSTIVELKDVLYNKESFNIFATEKQAKSAKAMAQISQIMANDERFGGVITDEEWTNDNMCKMVIIRCSSNNINFTTAYRAYNFLAFHTEEQRDLFLEENEDLVKDYLMID